MQVLSKNFFAESLTKLRYTRHWVAFTVTLDMQLLDAERLNDL